MAQTRVRYLQQLVVLESFHDAAGCSGLGAHAYKFLQIFYRQYGGPANNES